MQPTYGSIPGGEQQVLRSRMASRAAVCAAALAVLALVGVAAQLQSASPAALADKDINTYGDWLKTLHGPASYTGIGDETSDYGASQHNSKKGMRELVPGALPADAKIATMQGADFVDDVVRSLVQKPQVEGQFESCMLLRDGSGGCVPPPVVAAWRG